MARDWEAQFREWGHPPGTAEQTKMENTEAQIRKAIDASTALSGRTIQVAAQGSYRNLTHIPRESDVDIRVVLKGTFFTDFTFVDPDASTDAMFRRFDISPGTYSFDDFRDDVGDALVARFGASYVKPGDKVFNVRETRYSVEADVLAAFEHRRYYPDGTYDEGVEFVSRKGERIVNWPDQQNRNGVAKNKDTHDRFKTMVRVVKNLRAEMEDEGVAEAEPISSFLIECLVWNVPNDHFGHTAYRDDMRAVLAFLFNETRTDDTCSEWGEESEMKYLFRPQQPWTRQEAHAFISEAWDYVGFE